MALSQQDLEQVEKHLNNKYGVINIAEYIRLNRVKNWDSTWDPTYTAGGSMSYSGTTTQGLYKVVGNICDFNLLCTGTTSGTAARTINFTLPVPPDNLVDGTLICNGAVDNNAVTNLSGFGLWNESVGAVAVNMYDGQNFVIASGVRLFMFGSYRVKL